MLPAEVARFKDEIGTAQHYLEHGSGDSAVYGSRMGVQTTSVENDRFYARAVASQFHGKTVSQIVVGMALRANGACRCFPVPAMQGAMSWRR